jgi:hypothetical protein
MADLTQKDRDNYNKLKEAFKKLTILNPGNTPTPDSDSILAIKATI